MTIAVLDARNGPVAVLQLGENTAEAARQAALSSTAKNGAVTARAGSESARDAAFASINPYPTQAAGEAATSTGEMFSYLNGSNEVVLAKRESSGSTELNTYFGSEKVGAVTGDVNAVIRSLKDKLRDKISVKDFGAKGDGSTDDTVAFNFAATFAATVGAIVMVPDGTHLVDEWTLPAGIGGVSCDGIIKGRGNAAVAVVVVGDELAAVEHAQFNFKIDMSAGDAIAVQGYGTRGCGFQNCEISGFINHASNHFGIRMNGECTGNTFSSNRIELFNNPSQRGFGIAIYGTQGSSADWGGYFAGSPSRAEFPAQYNTITGNVILDGSYGISLQHTEFCTVTGNTCRNQNHRGIFFGSAAYHNVVTGNLLFDYRSSGILLSYGSSNNMVSANILSTTFINGEAGINVQSGSQLNTVTCNMVSGPTNFGVYIGPDCIGSKVLGNDIEGSYVAGIAVENDWIDAGSRPANHTYARPNYGVPPDSYTSWSFVDLTGVVIKGNVIGAGYTGRNIAAIAVSQLNTPFIADSNDTDSGTKTSDITIDGNTVKTGDRIEANVWFYEHTAGGLTDLKITGNGFHPANLNRMVTPAGFVPFGTRVSYFSGNREFDKILAAEELAFADGDTTPSVATNAGVNDSRLFKCANTSPTQITNFDDSFGGQEIKVRLDSNTTIVYGSGTIRTKGNVNLVGTANVLIAFRKLSNGIWYEMWRNA